MSLLLPLGLLGLIGIIILLIIYLIKPNYQNKFISSTFVWKLSLKYRKKKLPTSKLRNILLIICQILIITIAAMILAKPIHEYETSVYQKEVIAIVDSSVSMRTETEGETRYERAIDKIKKLGEQTFAENGVISVVLANDKPSFCCERIESKEKAIFEDSLSELVTEEALACSYGTSNIDSAVNFCEEILRDNPTTEIYLYTDATYLNVPKGINVVNVKETGEYNCAILNAYTELNDAYYDIIVEVACYGKDWQFDLNVFVDGANADDKYSDGSSMKLSHTVYCSNDQTLKVIFKGTGYSDMLLENEEWVDNESNRFYSFNSITVYLEEADNFDLDNSFQIYGGQKEVIKFLYSTALENKFIPATLMTLKNAYASTYDIQYTIDKKAQMGAARGYDYYIYEHYMPSNLPDDGVIILIDPRAVVAVEGTANTDTVGFKITKELDYNKTSMYFEQNVENDPLLKSLHVSQMTCTRLLKLDNFDAAYTVLASVDDNPVLMYRKEGKAQLFVMTFSLNYSNLPILLNDLPFLFNNILNYYTAPTVKSNSCEVYEEVTVNSRSEYVYITKDGQTTTYNEFPITLVANTPGTYDITQTTYYGKEITESLYVGIPNSESVINQVYDTITEPYSEDVTVNIYDDLLFYFALALVLFTALEWFLKNRDNI